MFQGCYSLQTIPLIDTSKGTNFGNMFQGCYSLQTIPLLNTSNITNLSNIFQGCYKLSKAVLSGTMYSISYGYCPLSRQSIIDIFNSLGTVSSATIILTECYGAASLTTEDKAIATAKGWTITI
jgi:surface protein